MKADCFECKEKNKFQQDCAKCINFEVNKIVEEHIRDSYRYIIVGVSLVLLVDLGLLYICSRFMGE